MKKLRIIVIEDNRILRDGIIHLLKAQEDMSVIGSSAGSNGIIVQIRQTKPQIILMDLGLRSQNGLRIVASITKGSPRVKVVGMGLIPAQTDIVDFVKAGAHGFILKDATENEFLETIRSVARGDKVLPSLLSGSIFSHVVDHALNTGKATSDKNVRMTSREREIIALIAEALSNKEIASRLNIATYTVKSHVHNILEKLALHSRLQIAKHSHDDSSSD